MSRSTLALVVVSLLGCSQGLRAGPLVDDGELARAAAVRVLVGNRDREPADWQGTIKVEPGRLTAVDVWMPEGRDQAGLDGTFSLRTHRARPRPGQRGVARDTLPVQPNGLLLQLADVTDSSRLTLTAAQGTVTVALADLASGRQPGLQGGVQFEALAPARKAAGGPDFDDYPAVAAAADGTTYCAYTSFTPAEQWRTRPRLETPPDDFQALGVPTGGDRLWLAVRRAGQWAEPVAVTDANLDLWRPAVAVDGQGTPWVFWSQNTGCDAGFENGDWELWARPMKPDQPGRPVRLTTASGADIFPSAATDSQGRVWVAWMALRNGEARIVACRQEGAAFGAEQEVANSPRSEWTPCLTTSADGQVAVVWDTYQKGDYDVYARLWRDGRWADPQPIAGSRQGEMNASAVFDGAGRLWVAYELSPEDWAKDFGPMEPGKKGVPIFQGRRVEVRTLVAGQVRQPKAALPDALIPPPAQGQGQRRPAARAMALARIGVDGGGRVWATARLRLQQRDAGVGAIWYSHASCYLGDRWSPPVLVSCTDANQDYRPVFLPAKGGGLLLVQSADRRQAQRQGAGQVQDDLWEAYVSTTAAPTEPVLEPVAEPVVVAPAADTEAADIARMRAARYTLNGQPLTVRRGEFHRHTEFSGDGGGDGTHLDLWRYGRDAADLDWVGFGDHDNGNGREYSWWLSQKTTQIFHQAPRFTPLFTYERSVNYPDGHRNVVFARRGVRTLARLQNGLGKDLDQDPAAPRPPTPDTQMLYRYLQEWNGICASHTSGTDMGTDWRNNDPLVEPVVEIYQGDRNNYEAPGAPRSASGPDNGIGGWRPMGFVSLALLKGYKLGFQSSSDHVSTHMSYCNLLVTEPTREAQLAAFRARRCYGSTDNILGDFRCETGGRDHLMGESFEATGNPRFRVLIEGSQPLAKVVFIRDNAIVYTATPNQQRVELQWEDTQPNRGRESYYYVRGEQTDGELVWLSPMWITVRG